MKNFITSSVVALGILLTAALVMTSCIKEPSKINKFKAGKPVTVAFTMAVEDPVTRTRTYTGPGETGPPAHGNPEDIVISSFRVLVYEATGNDAGKLRWNIPINLSTNPSPYSIPIETGTYDFVFIANEKSDNDLQ